MKARVMLVHNHYRTSEPSGEAQVLAAERALLQRHGHTLQEFSRFSDEILNDGLKGKIKGALSTPWNPFAASAVKKEVDRFLPDVVHVHNTFPLLSPAIFHSIGTRAARVLTLHNYRLFCSAAIPMRSGKPCTECIDNHKVWPAIKHGCYKNSRIATLPLATSVALHRRARTWINEVDAFITLTEFQRDLMIKAGLPADLVHIKPNFYPGNPTILPWEKRSSSVVFVGRLTAEKGVESLLRAWMMWGPSAPELRIVGDGGLRKDLEQLATKMPQVSIRFLGQLSNTSAQQEIARSRLLVLPSVSLETFGLVILEAFASGTPVAVSDVGPLASIVCNGENGIAFLPNNPQSLLDAVKTTWESDGKLEHLAVGAMRSFESLYTEDLNYRKLLEIYEQASEVSRARKAP